LTLCKIDKKKKHARKSQIFKRMFEIFFVFFINIIKYNLSWIRPTIQIGLKQVQLDWVEWGRLTAQQTLLLLLVLRGGLDPTHLYGLGRNRFIPQPTWLLTQPSNHVNYFLPFACIIYAAGMEGTHLARRWSGWWLIQ
jgi:hypothetical protein